LKRLQGNIKYDYAVVRRKEGKKERKKERRKERKKERKGINK
jgi:hypothetical protein